MAPVGKPKGKIDGKNVTKSSRAGLVFPVGRLLSKMKKGNYADRIGVGAGVYLAGVLEYLTAEILELAGNAAKDNKKARIIPRHILLAIHNDEEISRLLSGIVLPAGGVMPNIHSVLLPKKNKENVPPSKGGPGGNTLSQEY